jgi:hypothetical protein
LDGESINLHRVPYDIDATVKAARSINLPIRIYENLYVGAQIGGRIDKVIIG